MPSIAVQLAHTGAMRLMGRKHFDFMGQITALGQIARRTRRYNIVPCRMTTL
jgi:hypothetical protein